MNEYDQRFMAAQAARGRHRLEYWRRNDRKNYVCPDCGATADDVDHWHVHHKDGDPFNGDEDNLVALCPSCHHDRHGHEQRLELPEWMDEFPADVNSEDILDDSQDSDGDGAASPTRRIV